MSRAQHHYEAWCERDGRAWSVDVPALRIHTFGHTLGETEEMAKDAIASLLDIPLEDVSVSLHVQGVEDQLTEARKAKWEATERERKALVQAVEALRQAGASQRDAALLLGVSHQRISQISAATKATV